MLCSTKKTRNDWSEHGRHLFHIISYCFQSYYIGNNPSHTSAPHDYQLPPKGSVYTFCISMSKGCIREAFAGHVLNLEKNENRRDKKQDVVSRRCERAHPSRARGKRRRDNYKYEAESAFRSGRAPCSRNNAIHRSRVNPRRGIARKKRATRRNGAFALAAVETAMYNKRFPVERGKERNEKVVYNSPKMAALVGLFNEAPEAPSPADSYGERRDP